MQPNSMISRLCTAATATLCAIAHAATAQATPEPTAARIVVLGDSFASNSIGTDQHSNQCDRNPRSWPNQLAQTTGATMVDVSCAGAALDTGTGWNLAHQARKAADAAAFGAGTEAVLLQFGLNDIWGDNDVVALNVVLRCAINLLQGCEPDAAGQGRLPDLSRITAENYAARIARVIEYVRYYAPHARIALVGYPEFFEPTSTTACLGLFGLGTVVQPRAAGLAAYLTALRAATAGAAAALGIEYFDTAAAYRGHGMCSAEPWLNGIGDPRAELLGIPGHPAQRGDAATAAGIRQMLGLS